MNLVTTPPPATWRLYHFVSFQVALTKNITYRLPPVFMFSIFLS